MALVCRDREQGKGRILTISVTIRKYKSKNGATTADRYIVLFILSVAKTKSSMFP